MHLFFFPIWIKSEDFAVNIPFICLFLCSFESPALSQVLGPALAVQPTLSLKLKGSTPWGACCSHRWED